MVLAVDIGNSTICIGKSNYFFSNIRNIFLLKLNILVFKRNHIYTVLSCFSSFRFFLLLYKSEKETSRVRKKVLISFYLQKLGRKTHTFN